MRVLCVIPARIGSTRLPEKPLREIAGEPLIRWAVRLARAVASVDHVVVATDDERIVAAVAGLHVETSLTGPAENGTLRVAAVAQLPRFRSVPVVLNLQADEPFLPPEVVEGTVGRVLNGDAIATAAGPLPADGEARRHVTKVTVDADGVALDFSRGAATVVGRRFRHIGVYAYRRAALIAWATAPAVPAEIEHRLEQLRPMASGMRIGVYTCNRAVPPGVDTWDDLEEAERWLRVTRTKVRV